MIFRFICSLIFITSFITASEEQFVPLISVEETQSQSTLANDETDEIYWETQAYLSKLEMEHTAAKVQYVYHRRNPDFIGNWIIPLNIMPYMDGYSEVYKNAIAKYEGRENLLTVVIPTLNCLWNDVVFLSPIHPHKQYEEYKKIGFTTQKRQFYKIPVSLLEEKRVTVWKWLSYKKYPQNDPIHDSIESYCSMNYSHYQELEELPEDTQEYYRLCFDPENPKLCPPFAWYRIPHILCQDPIDISDERITLINWEDPIEENETSPAEAESIN